MSHAPLALRSICLATLSLAVLLAGAVGCHDSNGVTFPGTDHDPPQVMSTTPTDGAIGMAADTTISAVFSETMTASTINGATFWLAGPGATPMSASVTYDASTSTATLVPTSPLARGTTYTATISTGAKDLAGRGLVSAEVWSFTTSPAPDAVAPIVIATVPGAGAVAVAVDTLVTATFSEAMNAATISNATFTVAGPGATPVAGNVTYDPANHVATFTPASALSPNTTYTATITRGAQDLAGNALATSAAWMFTTGSAPNGVPPRVTSTLPVNGAAGVAVNTAISATFSEAMNAATITNATFTVVGPGAIPVTGAVTYNPATHVASFTPAGALLPSTAYTARITTGARDVAGDALANDAVWTFTTGTAADTLRPTVISTVPANGASGVPVNQVVTATFSEAMNAATITNATFRLSGPGATPVAGTVTYSSSSHVASFTPTSPLLANVLYTATVTTGARDAAGNALATDKVWTFTTGSTADVIAPTVISTVPADGAVGVPINQVVTATFSEAMNAATITPGTFTLAGPGPTPVAGTVAYSPATRVASFTPASALAPGTTYTATVTTGAMDVAGNALAADEVWTFTTGVAADTVRPTVISTVPANGASGVPINQVVTATFSEAMNAATITNATFTLGGPGATPVAGTVTYSPSNHVASFTPASPLLANALYTATVTTGARDAAGNAMATDKVWTFSTGSTADVVAPTVISTVPADGAVGVPINQVVTATFSEAMNAATITPGTFMLAGPGPTPVTGTVAYSPATRVASFTPASALAPSTTYTATMTTGARDVAGNALAADEVWSFTTGVLVDVIPPTVISTVPNDGATGVPINQTITATFSEDMNASTLTPGTFMLDGPGPTPVTGTVDYDALARVASFTPSSPLAPSTVYRATITTEVRDVAGNAMAMNRVWSFKTANQPSVPLGNVSSFAILAGSTVTNTGPTNLVGDLGVSPGTAVTGFPPGTLTGTIHAGDPAAATAKNDLDSAYNDAAGRSQAPITVAGNLGGQTLAPGLYKSTSSLEISSGNLTLDAQGDPNAVWIFQMASTLTTTPGRAVVLSGGARAANVYWQVGTSATLGVGSSFKGTIMADQSITLNTGATLEGRAVTRIGAVTLSSNSVMVPSP